MLKYIVVFALVSGYATALQLPCIPCTCQLSNEKYRRMGFSDEEEMAEGVRFVNDAGKAPSGTCKSVVVTPCAAEPCELKKGTNVTFAVTFEPSQPATKLTSVVYGIINRVPVKFPLPNPDGCTGSGIQCPLQTGQTYTYSDQLFVQKIYPTLSLVAQWSLNDDNGNPIFCVFVPAKIVS